jgi:glycosyltransferase involved in cell wall biosynthesis
MKILHIVPSIIDRSDGVGFFVRNLANYQAKNGLEVVVLTNEYDHLIRYDFKVVCCTYSKLYGNLRFSWVLLRWLKKHITDFDIVHNHGMWMFANVAFSFFKVQRTIFSPHGTMAPEALRRSKLKKIIFWYFLQRRAVFKSNEIHVTSEKERIEVKAFLKKGFNPIIIPIGIDVNATNSGLENVTKKNQIIFLGRVHNVKRVKELIQAWGYIEDKVSNWELKIVGPINSAYARECISISKKIGLKKINFTGELLGSEKLLEIKRSKLAILPSITENFSVSVLECLALGVPIIVSKNTPWTNLDKYRCGWIIDPNVESIIDGTLTAICDFEKKEYYFSKNAKNLVNKLFTWNSVHNSMLELYSKSRSI